MPDVPASVLDMPIEKLGLSTRPLRWLKQAGDIHYVGELLQNTERELLRIPNLGRVSLA
jgi:DNA-directed RNA polymerase subunit alpha